VKTVKFLKQEEVTVTRLDEKGNPYD